MLDIIISGISSLLLKREIRGFDNEPYLERYSIIRTKWFSAYLHKFVDSDPDRGLHTHPFAWSWSMILYGEYRELTEFCTHRRVQFSVSSFDHLHKHRVLLQKKPCWTLFIHGIRLYGWGFYRDGNYIPFSTSPEDDSVQRAAWKKATRPIVDTVKQFVSF